MMKNPPPVFIARMLVNMATMIWAIIVIVKDHALDGIRFPYYARMTDLMDENYWAAGALAISCVGMLRILCKASPHWIGSISYASQMLFWFYLSVSLFIDYPGPLPPATTAASIVVAILSCYAFISHSKVKNGHYA